MVFSSKFVVSDTISIRTDYYSWGRYPRVSHDYVYKIYWTDELPNILATVSDSSCLPRGLGRSYGDSCLNSGRSLIDCTELNRILAFDLGTGTILCEAGVTLADILDICVPSGWFLPVTPGTKFVTVAGAIANDVHGKNHHWSGTFGRHVSRLLMYRSDRGSFWCGPNDERSFFNATVGGLGLTGVILAAEIKLKPINTNALDVSTVPFRAISEFIALSEESDNTSEYTVAWIDCFSARSFRGVFMRGNHSNSREAKRLPRSGPKVPFPLPDWIVNRLSIKLSNSAYFWTKSSAKFATVHYSPFFYPLDSVLQWNYVYGQSGFIQYQFVIPMAGVSALTSIFNVISKYGLGSSLAVLKRFGSIGSPGMLSFPRPGVTLALDFAVRGERTYRLVRALDEIVFANGGALYPAKDSFMTPADFEASFPKWRDFQQFIDPKLSSSFWRRVTKGS